MRESASRYDGFGPNREMGIITNELELKWSKWIIGDQDKELVTCTIFYKKDHIYVDNLTSTIPDFGSKLFKEILYYLDVKYPQYPIVLYDVSSIGGKDSIPLYIAIFLKSGELSYYSRFGFEPFECDTDKGLVQITDYTLTYRQYSQKIKSITSRQALRALNNYEPQYTWISNLIKVLSDSDDCLMINEIKNSGIDIAKLQIHGYHFSEFIKKIMGNLFA